MGDKPAILFAAMRLYDIRECEKALKLNLIASSMKDEWIFDQPLEQPWKFTFDTLVVHNGLCY